MSARKPKQYRFITAKGNLRPSVSDIESPHIVEQKLNQKEELIDKYQSEIDQLLHNLNARQNSQTLQPRALLNKRERVRSSAKAEAAHYSLAIENPLADYKKIILGLEYSLENEKKTVSDLERKNRSLEGEVSNLRNLLVRAPTKQDNSSENEYEPGNVKAYRDRVHQLELQLAELKAKATYVSDSKTEAINALEKENRVLRSEFDSELDKGLMKKVNELVSLNEELRNSIYRKNLKIQRLRFGTDDNPDDKSVSSDDSNKSQNRKDEKDASYMAKKVEAMSRQFDIANQLILRKNTELLQVAKNKRTNEDVIAIIDSLLDKKEVASTELLGHPLVNKVRIFLRERVLFEKELFEKLAFHSKKIGVLEEQLRNKESRLQDHSSTLEQQCKELNRNMGTLQKQLQASDRELAEKKNELEIVRNDYAIEKKNFVLKMRELSQEMNGIISTTQQEFEKQKLENLKLAEQNRSLLFLVGSKQKELSEKGAAIRTFEKYKETINNLPIHGIDTSPSRTQTKLKSDSSSAHLIEPNVKPAKLLLLTTFSNWLLEWNKLRNWANRKSLLNILLDKQELRADALENSLTNLIGVVHECFFNSKNIQVQERASVLVAKLLPSGILRNKNLYVVRIAPYIIRCFRAVYEGEDAEQHRIYNEAALSFTDQLDQQGVQWNYEMTNQMIAVNGFKYVFSVISNDDNDELIEKAYNTLAVISKKNEMINFMVSYNITDIILKNMDAKYRFISHVLYLLETLLDSDEYLRAAAKYLLEFRSLFQLLLDDDPEVLQSALKCLLKLCKQSGFMRATNKRQAFPKLLSLLGRANNFNVLKQGGKLFMALLEEVEPADHEKIAKKELPSLLDLVRNNDPLSARFSRAARLLLKSLKVVNFSDFDAAVFVEFLSYMDENFDRVDEKTRSRMMEAVNLINERNRQFYEKNFSDEMLGRIVRGYLASKSTYTVELIFFLTLMKALHELKKTVDILKAGRQSLVNKLLEDAQQVDYSVSVGALKNLLALSKEKYSQKFLTPQNGLKVLKLACKDRSEQEYISLCLSALYFLSKFEAHSAALVESDLVPKMCNIINERHDSENVIFKVLAVLELNHTNHYKKRILNYLIANDKRLSTLRSLNQILRKSKNKTELGSRALFVYDFLNGQQQIQSLALIVENNESMVEELVRVRNDYVGILEPLVYKIQLLLHEMAKLSKKINKQVRQYGMQYERFIVERDEEANEDD